MNLYAAIDVHYSNRLAATALVEFQDFSSCSILRSLYRETEISAPYIPGKFYLRELPCILNILEHSDRQYQIVIIDGYVFLKEPVCFGLGGHLARAIGYETIIIGVAKNYLRMAERFVAVKRGKSSRPLYVSALNMETEAAGLVIKEMHGDNRIPCILKLADQISRK
jgi:deoxyribonuclease V